MKWPWQKDKPEPPLWLARRAIYDLSDPQQAAQAGLVLGSLTDQQWQTLAAVADYLRLRHVEASLGQARTPEDVAILAGMSEGMRRLLSRARDLVAEAKRESRREAAEEAAEILAAHPRADEL